MKGKYRNKDFFHYVHSHKKADCVKKGVDYNLDPEYLERLWTGVCPVFGVELEVFNKKSPNSYSLDRIKGEYGYIKGNAQFICWRANRIKYNATAEELRKIADYIDNSFEPNVVYSVVDILGKIVVDKHA